MLITSFLFASLLLELIVLVIAGVVDCAATFRDLLLCGAPCFNDPAHWRFIFFDVWVQGMVAMIMIRALKRDFTRYNRVATDEEKAEVQLSVFRLLPFLRCSGCYQRVLSGLFM